MRWPPGTRVKVPDDDRFWPQRRGLEGTVVEPAVCETGPHRLSGKLGPDQVVVLLDHDPLVSTSRSDGRWSFVNRMDDLVLLQPPPPPKYTVEEILEKFVRPADNLGMDRYAYIEQYANDRFERALDPDNDGDDDSPGGIDPDNDPVANIGAGVIGHLAAASSHMSKAMKAHRSGDQTARRHHHSAAMDHMAQASQAASSMY